MTTHTISRELFIGCLTSYNNGVIFGEWVNLCDFRDFDELHAKVDEILKASPYQGEEYDIQDSQGFGKLLGNYPTICKAWEIHTLLTEAEDNCIDTELFLDYLESEGYEDLIGKDDFLIERFQDSYVGSFDSLKDWAYDFVNDCVLCELEGNNRNFVERYFDYEAYARDCERSGDIWTLDNGHQVHVFNTYY